MERETDQCAHSYTSRKLHVHVQHKHISEQREPYLGLLTQCAWPAPIDNTAITNARALEKKLRENKGAELL